jgi:predicted lysophospholipase L1 biosynthesis ABC-type transport system permease subunit
VVEQVGAAAVGAPAGPAPAVYLSLLRHPPRVVELAVRSPGDPSLLAPRVERAIRAGASGALVADVMSMERRLASFREPLAWFGALFAALALGALLVATSSLYGVTAYGVERRRREIGIRMAVGATTRDVLRLIVGQTARVTVIGMGVGMVGALTVGRLLQERFAGIDPLDPLVYAPLALLFAAVAVVASYRPARRAALHDPQHSLREETA